MLQNVVRRSAPHSLDAVISTVQVRSCSAELREQSLREKRSRQITRRDSRARNRFPKQLGENPARQRVAPPSSWKLSRSQTRTVLSLRPDASALPSGLQATEYTLELPISVTYATVSYAHAPDRCMGVVTNGFTCNCIVTCGPPAPSRRCRFSPPRCGRSCRPKPTPPWCRPSKTSLN